jgi:hypothetical protein
MDFKSASDKIVEIRENKYMTIVNKVHDNIKDGVTIKDVCDKMNIKYRLYYTARDYLTNKNNIMNGGGEKKQKRQYNQTFKKSNDKSNQKDKNYSTNTEKVDKKKDKNYLTNTEENDNKNNEIMKNLVGTRRKKNPEHVNNVFGITNNKPNSYKINSDLLIVPSTMI